MKPALKPRKTPRQERSQTMVEAILEATARVLVEVGYARTNTNLVAETAGCSVGSLYQYFPNKEALVAALHQRHARQLQAIIKEGITAAPQQSLRDTVRALIHAVLNAHLLEPRLHRVLEAEVPELDQFEDMDVIERDIYTMVKHLLEAHRAEIAPKNLAVATQIVIRVMDSLVHATVIDPQPTLSAKDMETEITRVVVGYLTNCEPIATPKRKLSFQSPATALS